MDGSLLHASHSYPALYRMNSWRPAYKVMTHCLAASFIVRSAHNEPHSSRKPDSWLIRVYVHVYGTLFRSCIETLLTRTDDLASLPPRPVEGLQPFFYLREAYRPPRGPSEETQAFFPRSQIHIMAQAFQKAFKHIHAATEDPSRTNKA